MLAFNELGNSGRLGNQMFQYAQQEVLARKGYEWCIPPFGIPGLIIIVLRIVSSWKM